MVSLSSVMRSLSSSNVSDHGHDSFKVVGHQNILMTKANYYFEGATRGAMRDYSNRSLLLALDFIPRSH